MLLIALESVGTGTSNNPRGMWTIAVND